MRSRRPWCFSHPTTPASSRERNCSWMAGLHRSKPSIAEGPRDVGGRLVYNVAPLRVHASPFASQLSLLDGDMMQPGQPPLRVSPRLCSQLAQDFALRLGPEGPCHLHSSSPFRCEPHRLDPPVGVRTALEHAVALQEGKAAREGRLVDGELILQLLEARLTQACDRGENTE